MRVDRSRPGVLRSGAFRFALLLALVFAGGSAILLWTVQRQVGGYASQAGDAMVQGEASILAGEYRQLGLSGLIDAMERHAAVKPEAPFRYLLVDTQGKRLFGDLPPATARPGRQTFEDLEPDGQRMTVKQYGLRLPDGLLLIVATDTFDIAIMRERLVRFTVLSGLGITLFALIGGFLAGRLFLRRLDRVNHIVDRIIDGHSGERLPAIGVGPEFDNLTHNLNRMLDRNAAAMDGLKQVSTAIAHDLRTPLMRLRQRVEGLRETPAPDPVAMDQAVAQIDGILDTFQALLRIGMLEGGVGRQRFAALNLGGLMDRLGELYAPAAEDAEHSLQTDHQADVLIEGDADLLAQLFTNLIENAIVHSPPGTRITSRLHVEDGRAIATIADDGPGVPLEDREKIFRKFHRGDASRGTPGAGLGLSLVAAIAELHGATYRMPPMDKGFCLTLEFARIG